MRKRQGFILLYTIVWICMAMTVGLPKEAYACSCAMPASVQEELQRSEAVFSGKVIGITEKKGLLRSSADPLTVQVSVSSVWKGTIAPEVTIYTALSSASCGYGFQRNTEYLIYAGRDADGQLQTNLCSRTKPLSKAEEDLAALGTGQSPTGQKAAPSGQSLWVPWAGALGAMVIVYVLGRTVTATVYGYYLTRKHLPDLIHAHKTLQHEELPSEIHFGVKDKKRKPVPELISLAAAAVAAVIVYYLLR